ncbi:MAG: aspartyl protease [Xenococcaceae cyanobacterium]
MISGEFNQKGELVFEISLVGADGEPLPVEAILDTGFTGWLAMDYQQAESLDWSPDPEPQRMQTAQGEGQFILYEGRVIVDGEDLTIPVLGGDEFSDILLGVRWLQIKRLVADFPEGVLTLG